MQDPKLTKEITTAERDKLSQAFKDPAFQYMFSEFAQEMSTKEGRYDLEKQLEDAEKLAYAQSVVQTIQEEHKPAPRIGTKQPKTAAQKVQYSKYQHGIQMMEQELQKRKEEEAKTAAQVRNLESLYAQALKKPKPVVYQQQYLPQQVPSMTDADMYKLAYLVEEVDRMKADFMPGYKKDSEWPNQFSLVQNVDYGDYVESERINTYATRGADKARFEIGIPDDADAQKLELEVKRDKIVLRYGEYILEKQVSQPLCYKTARASLTAGKKFGRAQMLVVEVDIEKDPNAVFSEFRKQIPVAKYSEPYDVDDAEIDYLAQQIGAYPAVPQHSQRESLIQIPNDVSKLSKGWKPSYTTTEISVPHYDQDATFEEILRRQMAEKKRASKIKIDEICAGLEEYEKIGVSFTLRGVPFNFYNYDLVADLY